MPNRVLNKIIKIKENNQKALAVLLDPDKVELEHFGQFLNFCAENEVDFFFVGGSLISNNIMAEMIAAIHQTTKIPVILFPGSSLHIEPSADAILLLSLISGRNPDFLIGQHVISAPILKKSGLEILPTGYLLIESGQQTTASYISNTTPIPHNKPDIAVCTAMAGEMLGLKLIYLDGGSGAIHPVSLAARGAGDFRCAGSADPAAASALVSGNVGGGVARPQGSGAECAGGGYQRVGLVGRIVLLAGVIRWSPRCR